MGPGRARCVTRDAPPPPRCLRGAAAVTRASDRLGKKLLLNNTAAVDVSLQDDVYAQHPQPTRVCLGPGALGQHRTIQTRLNCQNKERSALGVQKAQM